MKVANQKKAQPNPTRTMRLNWEILKRDRFTRGYDIQKNGLPHLTQYTGLLKQHIKERSTREAAL